VKTVEQEEDLIPKVSRLTDDRLGIGEKMLSMEDQSEGGWGLRKRGRLKNLINAIDQRAQEIEPRKHRFRERRAG